MTRRQIEYTGETVGTTDVNFNFYGRPRGAVSDEARFFRSCRCAPRLTNGEYSVCATFDVVRATSYVDRVVESCPASSPSLDARLPSRRARWEVEPGREWSTNPMHHMMHRMPRSVLETGIDVEGTGSTVV